MSLPPGIIGNGVEPKRKNQSKVEGSAGSFIVSRMLKLALLFIVGAWLMAQSWACHQPVGAPAPTGPGAEKGGVSDGVKVLARETAINLFGAGSGQGADFARELVATYIAARGKDFVVIYNTGGFGGTTIDDDPEWSSIVYGIQSELTRLGYSSSVLEHIRGRPGLFGFIDESRDLVKNYSRKAPVLAAKVEFLTRLEDNLKVIITGRSLGAIFSSEVITLLAGNPRAYSIQAGHPFWYHRPQPQNTILIKDNGVMPDSFSEGDLWTILQANFRHLPSGSRPPGGSIKIGPFFLRTPGHEYTWNHTGVRERVIAFLEERFARHISK